ncbi:MAG: nitronate monooxygenase [Acidobacteriota bacterium]
MDLKKINFQFPKIELPKIELPKIELPKLKLPGINMPSLNFGDLKVRIPIIQGGMGVGISLSGLASAVAGEGGIGVIAANAIGMTEPDYFKNGIEANKRALRKEIRKSRENSRGIIGVNIMVALNDFSEMLNVAIEEKADVVFLGAGLPLRGIPIEEIKRSGIKVVPIVSSARAVKLIFSYWLKKYNSIPDGVVVEGPKAGGHLGFKAEQIEDPDFALEKIIPQVVDEVKILEKETGKKIPVIAAGGIFTGDDIHKFFKLGASGVQMGSRFVATEECDADIKFKESYLKSGKDDIVLINSPVGLPGRAVNNSFLKDVVGGEKKKFKCPWQCLESCKADKANYCISIALNNARKGNLNHGYAFAGSNAYRIDTIVPVKVLMNELKEEYLSIVESGVERLKVEYENVKRKLVKVKEEYEEALEKGFNNLKDDYNRAILKGSENFRDEIEKNLEKIKKLKAEYIEQFRKLGDLRASFVAEIS